MVGTLRDDTIRFSDTTSSSRYGSQAGPFGRPRISSMAIAASLVVRHHGLTEVPSRELVGDSPEVCANRTKIGPICGFLELHLNESAVSCQSGVMRGGILI